MAAAQLAGRVSFTHLKNMAMSEPNGALVKTSGENGWNATATSADCIAGADSKRRGISWRVSQDFTGLWFIGLVSAPSGQQQHQAIAQRVDDLCLTYAMHVGFYRDLFVYESGNSCGKFGSVQISDYIEIVLNSEKPPSIEYRVNGNLRYKSKTPIVFPLFPKICACNEGPLAEDLRWIVDPVTEIVELQAHIAELQIQLRKREEEKQDLQTSTEAKQAENEALLATIEQQKKEMKARNDALVAVTQEKAELLVQLEGAREASPAVSIAKAGMEAAQAVAEQLQKELKAEHEARLAVTKEKAELHMQLEAEKEISRAASDKKADEKLELQIRASRLQRENEALHKAIGDLADEKVQLQVDKKQMHAEIQVLRRQLPQSDGASSEAWEEVSSSAAASSG